MSVGGVTPESVGRPRITVENGRVCHNGSQCRVVLRPDLIMVGCTDITPEALEYILAAYRWKYLEEVILQEVIPRPADRNTAGYCGAVATDLHPYIGYCCLKCCRVACRLARRLRKGC